MKNGLMIILMNCALPILGGAQFYTYFDSLFYDVDTDIYGSHNILVENEDGYILSAISGHNSIQRPILFTCGLDGSNPEFHNFECPNFNFSSWFGPHFITTTDGGFVYSGISSLETSNIIKLSNLNDTLWTYKLEIQDSVIYSFQPLEMDDGYLVCGTQGLYNPDPLYPYPRQMLILKFSFEGQLLWKKKHTVYDPVEDGQNLKYMRFSGIFQLDNGDIVLSGAREHKSQPFIARMNSNGENLQMYEFGELEFPDWMPWLVPLESHQFMVGYCKTFELYLNSSLYPMSKTHLMLFDSDNMLPVWDNELSTDTFYSRFDMDMIQTNDGGFAKTGYYNAIGGTNVGFIEKLSSTGEIEWHKFYTHENPNAAQFDQNLVYDIATSADGGYLLCGSYRTGNLPERGWVLKLDACGDIEDLGCPVGVTEVLSSNQEIIAWPVPAQEVLHVQTSLPMAIATVQLTDMLGNIVWSQKRNHLHRSFDIQVSDLSAGVYILNVLDENNLGWSKKVVVE